MKRQEKKEAKKKTFNNLMFFVSIFTGTAICQILIFEEVWTAKHLELVEFALCTIGHISCMTLYILTIETGQQDDNKLRTT